MTLHVEQLGSPAARIGVEVGVLNKHNFIGVVLPGKSDLEGMTDLLRRKLDGAKSG